MRRQGHVLLPFTALTTLLCLFLLLNLPQPALAQQNAQCDVGNPCRVGCCSEEGQCGFTEGHCGDGCQGDCDAQAECGQYAPEGEEDCPINVCCSEHGFCGVTEEFCGDGCQPNSNDSGCGEAPSRSCDADSDPMNLPVRAVYYELFTKGRSCGVKEPEDIPLDPLTHVHLAFVNFDDSWQLLDEHSDWIKRMVHRKIQHPDVKMTIAIGGWAFNDPPTQHLFSEMANNYNNRQTFVRSVVDFLRTYGLDGVDIDWEYPGAEDRGGEDGDVQAYVLLLSDLRKAFEREGTGWEISIAIPSSYWYLRGFDLYSLQDHVDYFNLMSYDIHGMWDLDNEWTGPYLKGHTDWRKIEEGLELLWRNAVRPEKVVMGFGFYGRSFTMASPNCHEPNGVCQASDGGDPGSCTDTAGVLTYYEVASRNESGDVETFYDADNTVKYSVFDTNQWISYDDQQSFHDKMIRLSEKCLGGMMVWAVDQDTSAYDAMHALFGDFSHLGLDRGTSDEDLSDYYSQFTGQDCMVTVKCSSGSMSETHEDYDCPAGYRGQTLAHDPLQRWPHKRDGDCEEGEYRVVCCPTDSMPRGCSWNGDPVRSVIGCTGTCGSGYYELNRDTYVDYRGEEPCYQGHRSYCCESTKIIDDCYWTDCDGPFIQSEYPECRSGYDWIAYRHDKPDGDGLCRETYGNNGSPLIEPFKSSLCCPEERSFDECNWANNPVYEPGDEPFIQGPETWCRIPRPCREDQIKIADATYPQIVQKLGPRGYAQCDSLKLPSGYDTSINLCCSPHDIWGEEDWPVDPEHLWDEEFDDPETDDALWEYESHHTNNDEDDTRDGSHEINGDDSFGFMMLNGPKETLDDHFGESHTVVQETAEVPKIKRQILTANKTKLEAVFDHTEETFFVYCNHKKDSEECNRVWAGGVQDTIIRLPAHVGEGPFARVVSMELAPDEYQLPEHHIKHRSTDSIDENPIYEVKVDYDFAAVRQDRGHVNIRVDYTNLMEYWDEVTSAPAKRSRIKRGLPEESEDGPFKLKHFRDRVKRAHATEEANPLKKRRAPPVKATVPMRLESDEEFEYSEVYDERTSAQPTEVETRDVESSLGKRWWGTFTNWLRKTTTVQDDSKGDLPLDFAQKINIFRQSWGCPGKGYRATLRMDLDAEFSMQATYAYYYSGTFIPPSTPDVFFYFGIEPEAYLGLSLDGNVRLNASTHRTKIIDTLSYPGLAIKGIASVGPTLDVYGQITGFINIHGKAKTGAKVTFGRAEAYWPQDEAALEEYDSILGLDLKKDPELPQSGQVEPVFQAGVKIEAGLDIIIQPEAHVGIKVGGGSLVESIIDAQITGFVKGILQFFASGTTTSGTRWDYDYGVFLYYNVGYNAKATIFEWADWALGARTAYNPDRRITIFRDEGTIDLAGGDGRLASTSGSNASIEDLGESVFRRQSDDIGMSDPDQPALTSPLGVCPDGGDSTHTIPELRFNCGAFPTFELRHRETNDVVYVSESMCGAYAGASGSGRKLTHAPILDKYDNNALATEIRREAMCPTGSCDTSNENIRTRTGRRRGQHPKTSCDEFPWASSEEGGENTPFSQRSTRCVPDSQNGAGGACIKMLSDLSTNVGLLEEPRDPDIRETHFKRWTEPFWQEDTTIEVNANTGFEVRQRLIDHDEDQLLPVGKDPYEWDDWRKGWYHKRSYTFSFADQGEGNFWGATETTNVDNSDKRHDDAENIVCAINIFNEDYYKWPQQTDNSQVYNGRCFKASTFTNSPSTRWTPQHNIVNCRITYAGDLGPSSTSAQSDKRDVDPWRVEHIEYLPEEEADAETFDIADMLGLTEEEMSEYEIVYTDAEKTADGSSTSEGPVNEASTSLGIEIDNGIESALPVVAEDIKESL